MGMDLKIIYKLQSLGFMSVLHTMELDRPIQSKHRVTVGTPLTWDTNCGILVIYDDLGHPWIRRTEGQAEEIRDAFKEFNLRRGGYVPHSRDNGEFASKFLDEEV